MFDRTVLPDLPTPSGPGSKFRPTLKHQKPLRISAQSLTVRNVHVIRTVECTVEPSESFLKTWSFHGNFQSSHKVKHWQESATEQASSFDKTWSTLNALSHADRVMPVVPEYRQTLWPYLSVRHLAQNSFFFLLFCTVYSNPFRKKIWTVRTNVLGTTINFVGGYS